MKDILLIGDWLIDEHWLTGVHRSATSSRVGQSHFRGLQSSDCAIHSFCGAGQTASALLRSVSGEGASRFKIFGIGLWNESDTAYLSSILKACYPDVQWVSEKVLQTFYEFPNPAIRDIKHFVKAFLNIQYGKVLAENIPVDWLKVFRKDFDLNSYQTWPEGALIKISRRPEK